MKQEHLYQITHALAEKWAENAESNLQEMVDNLLQDRFEEFVMRVLGFEVQYANKGRTNIKSWRIDHCNGRSGNSAIGSLLNTMVAEKIDNLIGRMELTDEELLSIKKSAREVYLRKYKEKMNSAAARKAEVDASEYVKKTVAQALDGAAESVRLRLMEANS